MSDIAQIESVVRPFVQRELDKVIDRIEGAYNNPETPFEYYFGCAAEIVALRNLLKEVSSQKRAAIRTLAKEVAHAQK